MSKRSERNGLNPRFGEEVHCLAAEPHETFLRVSILDSDEGQVREVAFETAVLGRLRPGFRVLPLRNRLGTRIEQCYLFVKISLGQEVHRWQSASEVRAQLDRMHRKASATGGSSHHHERGPQRSFAV